MAERLACKFSITCLLLVAVAQGHSTHTNVISSAENPELVSDNEAFMMLMLHMSDGPKAMPLDARHALFDQSDLTDEEISTVIAAANVFRSSYASIMYTLAQVKKNNAGKPLTADSKAQLDSIVAKGWAAVGFVRKSLEAKLGPTSSQKLWKFINTTIRPTVIIVPGN